MKRSDVVKLRCQSIDDRSGSIGRVVVAKNDVGTEIKFGQLPAESLDVLGLIISGNKDQQLITLHSVSRFRPRSVANEQCQANPIALRPVQFRFAAEEKSSFRHAAKTLVPAGQDCPENAMATRISNPAASRGPQLPKRLGCLSLE